MNQTFKFSLLVWSDIHSIITKLLFDTIIAIIFEENSRILTKLDLKEENFMFLIKFELNEKLLNEKTKRWNYCLPLRQDIKLNWVSLLVNETEFKKKLFTNRFKHYLWVLRTH